MQELTITGATALIKIGGTVAILGPDLPRPVFINKEPENLLMYKTKRVKFYSYGVKLPKIRSKSSYNFVARGRRAGKAQALTNAMKTAFKT